MMVVVVVVVVVVVCERRCKREWERVKIESENLIVNKEGDEIWGKLNDGGRWKWGKVKMDGERV